MATLDKFNASEHDDPGFDPIPEGDYLVIIESSELKPTKAGTGTRINLKLQVIDGAEKGRTVFWGINYTNPNEVAQRIGRAELAMACRAVGILQPKDTMEMHNIPFYARVVVKPADRQYAASNEVKKAVSKAEHKAEAPPVAAGAGKAPWAK